MELTDKQKEAIEIAYSNFIKGKDTIIAGYAGTGKSTLVKELILKIKQKQGLYDREITYAAYTGKAAQVLTNKDCPAVTLHKLLYNAKFQKDGTVSFELKDELDYRLIVIDECSMVPINMYYELKSFDIPVIWLGDPGQLPPIQESANNHLLDHPDIFLTEVLRQAQDSGIIRLSMLIREGKDYSHFDSPEATVIGKYDLKSEDLKDADMILVASNRMRQQVNKAMRAMLGRTKYLVAEGEKVICTQNYWEKDNIEKSLTNGSVGFLTKPKLQEMSLGKRKPFEFKVISTKFTSEYGLEKSIPIDKKFLETEESTLSPAQKVRFKDQTLPREFTYAYAITGHKSQGSEWDKVIVMEENWPLGEDHIKWLYTCVTRARKRLILVRS